MEEEDIPARGSWGARECPCRRQEAEGGGEQETGAHGGGSGPVRWGRFTSPLLPMWKSREGWSTGARCADHSVKDCSGGWAEDSLRKRKSRGSQWATAWTPAVGHGGSATAAQRQGPRGTEAPGLPGRRVQAPSNRDSNHVTWGCSPGSARQHSPARDLTSSWILCVWSGELGD